MSELTIHAPSILSPPYMITSLGMVKQSNNTTTQHQNNSNITKVLFTRESKGENVCAV